MRSKWIGIAIVATAGLVLAQSPTSPDLHLRGNRFKLLTYAELTPAQKIMADHLLSGERGGLNGPYNVFLRSPEMAIWPNNMALIRGSTRHFPRSSTNLQSC